MSRNTVVAKRYAKALFELAAAQHIASQVEEELKLVVLSLGQDEEIVKFLSLPSVEASSKIALLKSALGDKVSDLVLNTLELLIERRRQDIIAFVYEAYIQVAGEALSQARATVYSAQSLSDAELAEVVAKFSKLTGKKIIAEQKVEPTLLGGIQVRIGDRLYDGSLSGKLDRLQKSLKLQAL